MGSNKYFALPFVPGLNRKGFCSGHIAILKCLQAIIRAVCAIIDAFHFATELPEEAAEAAAPADAAQQSSPQAPKDAAYVADIQKALAKRVLPALQKQLVCHICYLMAFTLTPPSVYSLAFSLPALQMEDRHQFDSLLDPGTGTSTPIAMCIVVMNIALS